MSQHDWIEGDLSPRHLVRASEEFGSTLSDILALCDQLAPLGVQVANRAGYPDDIELIELLALHYLSTPGQLLSPLHVIMIAGRAGISVGTAYDGLGRLERNGLLVRPQITGPSEFAPARQDLSEIASQMLMYSRGGREEEYIESPWTHLIDTILDKRSTGSQQQLAQTLVKFILPAEGDVGWLHLIQIAFSSDKTILGAAEAISEIYPEIPLPEIGPDVAGLTVSWGVFMSLVGWRRRREWKFGPWTMVYSVLNSRQLLGDLLYELNKFGTLGVPVPFCDESVQFELNQVALDEYDLDMLEGFDELGDYVYLRRIEVFQLLQISARYGWTLTEAHQRFSRLVPIGLELNYPQVDLPNEIVYWYDLLALTTYFDGQEPVVSGRIDQAYLERAAEEIFDVKTQAIPEKAALLRERLKIYAPLFQFELVPY